MHIDLIIWDDEDDPRGNVRHIEAAGLTPEDVEEVLRGPHASDGISRAHPHRPMRFGWTQEGKYIAVIYEVAVRDPLTIIPITAYEVPGRRRDNR